eukprot:TRINITY_DN4923_c0_g1_i1.p1 TRINITY_DN4923_c0_g1~~TRINITY_DN4923_c0_g1_i1.p1  ORF type:complete len:421 (+),score=192.72 TRINITY_DN4923_c0_g1_i1:369-1631(+)
MSISLRPFTPTFQNMCYIDSFAGRTFSKDDLSTSTASSTASFSPVPVSLTRAQSTENVISNAPTAAMAAITPTTTTTNATTSNGSGNDFGEASSRLLKHYLILCDGDLLPPPSSTPKNPSEKENVPSDTNVPLSSTDNNNNNNNDENEEEEYEDEEEEYEDDSDDGDYCYKSDNDDKDAPLSASHSSSASSPASGAGADADSDEDYTDGDAEEDDDDYDDDDDCDYCYRSDDDEDEEDESVTKSSLPESSPICQPPFWFQCEDIEYIEGVIGCYKSFLPPVPKFCRSMNPFVACVARRLIVTDDGTIQSLDEVTIGNCQRIDFLSPLPIITTISVVTQWDLDEGLPSSSILRNPNYNHCSFQIVEPPSFLYCLPKFNSWNLEEFSFFQSDKALAITYAENFSTFSDLVPPPAKRTLSDEI